MGDGDRFDGCNTPATTRSRPRVLTETTEQQLDNACYIIPGTSVGCVRQEG